MTPLSRAILFRVGGLGDLLVALPAVSLVRRALPDFHLTLAARPEYGALFKAAGIVDEVATFDDPRLAAVFARDDAWVRGRNEESEERSVGAASLAGFDLATGWLNRRGEWPDEREWARQGVGRAFFAFYAPASGVPMSRYFFDRTLAFVAGVRTASSSTQSAFTEEAAGRRPSPGQVQAAMPGSRDSFDDCSRLRLGREDAARALAELDLCPLGPGGRRLVVHPGSGGRAKRWPLGNFVEVVRRAASRGVEGVLVTGEAEAELETEIARLALPTGWARASRLSAMTLAGLLTASTHYIGNDSGPTHVAAACEASVIAVFLDENLPAWRPFGRTRVLSAPAVERVQLAAVLAEMDDLLGA